MNFREEIRWFVYEFLFQGYYDDAAYLIPHADFYAELFVDFMMAFLIVSPFIIFWKLFKLFIP